MAQGRPNERPGMWVYPDGSIRPDTPNTQNKNRQPGYSSKSIAQNQNRSAKSQTTARTAPGGQNAARPAGVRQPPNNQSRNPNGNGVNPRANPNVRKNPNNPNVNANRGKRNGPMTVSQVRDDRKKRRINPQTSEIERKRRQREQFRIKKRRKDMLRIFAGRFILFLISFAILGSMLAVLFAYNFLKTEEKTPAAVKYTIGENSPQKSGYDAVVVNGNVYINFSAVAEYLQMSVTGDTNVLNYIIADQTNEYSIDVIAKKEENKNTAAEAEPETQDVQTGGDPDSGSTDSEEIIPPTDSAGEGTEETISFEINSNKVWVNKQEITLSVPNELRGKNLWVDSRIMTYINGITFQISGKNTEISAVRNVITTDTGEVYKTSDDKTVYEFISLKLKRSGAIEKISEDIFASPAIEFIADLSGYEMYMNPEDKDAYLTLVNYENMLDAAYIPPDLTNIKNTRADGRAVQQMREYPAKALEAMFLEMNANNIWNVSVTSGYRSYGYQEVLYNQKVSEYSNLSETEARAKAAAIVAVPGTSEHQSGLCSDLHNLASADVSFANTGAYAWLSENAHKFGFIVRYPEDKVDITKITFEPWHYRYVGRYHATRMYELGMCLEEYMEYLNK